MHAIMWTKCSYLFQGSSVPEEIITRGIEQRMYDARKNWQIRLPKRLKQTSMFVLPVDQIIPFTDPEFS